MRNVDKLNETAINNILLNEETYSYVCMGSAGWTRSANQKKHLITTGVAPCIVVVIREPQSKFTLLAHISPDSNALETQTQLLTVAKENSISVEKLEVTLLGGWKSQYPSFHTGTEIHAFWEEQKKANPSLVLNAEKLFERDCLVLPMEIIDVVYNELVQNFGQEKTISYINKILNDPENPGILYSFERKDEISKTIAALIRIFARHHCGLTKKELQTFPLCSARVMHDERNVSAEKRLCVDFFRSPRCCFSVVLLDIETGNIFISDDQFQIIDQEIDSIFQKKMQKRSETDLDKLQIECVEHGSLQTQSGVMTDGLFAAGSSNSNNNIVGNSNGFF